MKKILRDIGYGLLILLSISVLLSFFFFGMINRNDKMVYQMTGQHTSKEVIEKIKQTYGLNYPVVLQTAFYINNLLPLSLHSTQNKMHPTYFNPQKYNGIRLIGFGNIALYLKCPYLGKSFQTNNSVASIIANVLPNTMVLAFAAIVFATFFGIWFGAVAAAFADGWVDRFIIAFTTVFISTPSFVAAILASFVFGFLLHDVTGLQAAGSLYEINDYTGKTYLALPNLILPAITLGVRPIAIITQLTRNNIQQVYQKQFVLTAQAKGISRQQIFAKHALPNILNPLLSAVSGWLGSMLAGAVFVEYIFGWNGIGKEIVDALKMLDYPVVMGCILTISSIYIVLNLLVDVGYYLIDPRLRS